MLGELPLYDPPPPFSHMAEKAAVRFTTDMDREPCWPTPKGGYGGGAYDAKPDGIFVYSMITLISRELTIMSLCKRLTLLVVTLGSGQGTGGN
jgi:hypothetical protein